MSSSGAAGPTSFSAADVVQSALTVVQDGGSTAVRQPATRGLLADGSSVAYVLNIGASQCLQSLEDELIAVDDHVDDCRVVMDNWFTKHGNSQFPGLGVRAIAVPPSIVFTPRVQVLEACNHCSLSESCPATFFRVLGQESEQKERQALSIVYTGFQMLNEALEREGQPTMFVMANVHWDNILAWFKRGKQREKAIDSLFPHVRKWIYARTQTHILASQVKGRNY